MNLTDQVTALLRPHRPGRPFSSSDPLLSPLQGCLAHKKTPPSQDRRRTTGMSLHCTVRSYGEVFLYKRGTPVSLKWRGGHIRTALHVHVPYTGASLIRKRKKTPPP